MSEAAACLRELIVPAQGRERNFPFDGDSGALAGALEGEMSLPIFAEM